MVVGELELRLYADVARIKKDMDDCRRVVGDTMGSISGMADIAKRALGALGVAMSANAFAGMVKGSIEATARLHDLSIQTGASVASLMAFRSVASTSDTTIDGIGAAMNRMAKGMAVANEESKGVGNAVKALGLDFNALKAMTPDQQMLNVARALDRFQDGTGKSAVAMTLWGKEGAKMLPFLKDLAAESDAVTAKLSEQQIKAKAEQAAMADDFGDNVVKIKKAADAWKKDLAMGMLPALTDASDAFLKASSSANGLNSAIKKLSEDGSIERWTRNAIDGVTALGQAIIPAAKIWGAYYTAFVIAPATFAAVSTAIGTLQVQLALARMEMASGATVATLFGTSLGGVALSAELAAGALGVLKVAAGTVFAAFAGWEIGSYLRDNFVEARVAGLSFVGAVTKGWEHVKYGAEMAWEGIKFAWDKTVGGMKESFAQYLEGVARGLSFVGAADTSKSVSAYAESLRNASTVQSSFSDRTAGITAAHSAALAAIDKNIVELVSYEFAASGAAKAAGNLAKAGDAVKPALNFGAGNGGGAAPSDELRKQAALLAELAGLTGGFADDWAALSAVYAKGAISLGQLTKAQADLLAKQPAIKAMNDAEAKALSDQKKLMDDVQAGIERDIGSVNDQAKALERKVATYGMLPDAITAVQIAELEAAKQSLVLTDEGVADIQRKIDALGKLKEAQSASQMQDAAAEGAKRMAEEYQRASEQIGQSLTDNIMRGGKSAAEYLRDLFRTLVLRPILMPIGTAIGGAMTSMFMPGMAQASTGSGKDPISMAQAASNVYGMLKSGGTFEQSITNGVQSLFDKMGLSMGSGAPSQAAQWAGKAGGTIGGYMIGSSLNSMISGQYETGSGFMTAQKVGTAIASYFGGPIGGAIAGAIGGLINRAFGMGSKEVTTAGMRGTLSANGLTGTNYSNWHQDGGWFRSDRNGTDLSAFDPEVTKRFTEGFEAIKAMSAGFAEAIGQSADSLKDYAKTFDIVLGKDQAANEKAVSDFFDNLGNEIANSLVPNLYSLQKAGESASAALQRLAGDFQATDQMAQLIGKSAKEVFGSVGIESAAARERLIGLSGGVAALSQQAQFFSQNFMTEAERLKPVSEAVGTAMASLGLSAVTTREQFKQVALSLDLTTEQGARQYASMMRLAEAFAQVHPQIEATTDAVREQANAQQAMRDQASTMLGDVDSALSVLQRVMDGSIKTLSARIEKERALSQAIRSTLDSMTAPGNESAARANAQAQISTALAIAKAGGPLPESAAIQKALGVLSQDASSLFATQQDYLRDFYRTQNDIASLGDLADDALSVDERSLAAMNGMLESAQRQVDLLKGIDVSALTIAQAMAGLQTAIGSASANPVAGATGGIAAAYQSLLGRAPDSAGLAYWQEKAASGVTLDQIRAFIMDSAEYKRLRGFAVGINRVPVDMPAMIHKDEAVVPAALNPFNPNARANGLGGSTERLERLVENLTATVERQQQALNKIANTSKRSTDILEVVTEGGNAMRTTV